MASMPPVESSSVVGPESSGGGERPCLTRKEIAFVVCAGLAGAVALFLLLVVYVPSELNNVVEFYVGVTAAEGLVDATQAESPSFNFTLRIVNRRDHQTCTKSGAAVRILYAGLDIGWGVVPGLCVPKHASGDVKVVLTHPGVALSAALRDQMASDEHDRRRPELKVELEMIGADWSSRSTKLYASCGAI